jgi:hypothetical protein
MKVLLKVRVHFMPGWSRENVPRTLDPCPSIEVEVGTFELYPDQHHWGFRFTDPSGRVNENHYGTLSDRDSDKTRLAYAENAAWHEVRKSYGPIQHWEWLS